MKWAIYEEKYKKDMIEEFFPGVLLLPYHWAVWSIFNFCADFLHFFNVLLKYIIHILDIDRFDHRVRIGGFDCRGRDGG